MLLRGLLDLKTPSEGGKGLPDPGDPPANIYNLGFVANMRSAPLSPVYLTSATGTFSGRGRSVKERGGKRGR
jgi:hypothetical protein